VTTVASSPARTFPSGIAPRYRLSKLSGEWLETTHTVPGRTTHAPNGIALGLKISCASDEPCRPADCAEKRGEAVRAVELAEEHVRQLVAEHRRAPGPAWPLYVGRATQRLLPRELRLLASGVTMPGATAGRELAAAAKAVALGDDGVER
jgi:hypothetical protein